MTIPALPPEGSTDWYDHYAAVDAALRELQTAVDSLTPPPAFGVGSTKPDATNTGTGVIAAAPTETLTGDQIITVAGTTLENKIIVGHVDVRAANVTIRNCEIRVPDGKIYGVETDHASNTGLVVEFCEIYCPTATITVNGIGPRNFTARRNNIHGVVDGVRIFPATAGQAVNAVVEGNWVHDLIGITPNANHSDNKSHTDCIQIEGGIGARVVGNRFDAVLSSSKSTPSLYAAQYQALSCVMLTPNVGAITNLLLDKNWMTGAEIPVNGGADGNSATTGTISGNRFGRNSTTGHTITLDAAATNLLTPAGNVYEDDNTAVTIRRNG